MNTHRNCVLIPKIESNQCFTGQFSPFGQMIKGLFNHFEKTYLSNGPVYAHRGFKQDSFMFIVVITVIQNLYVNADNIN